MKTFTALAFAFGLSMVNVLACDNYGTGSALCGNQLEWICNPRAETGGPQGNNCHQEGQCDGDTCGWCCDPSGNPPKPPKAKRTAIPRIM
ncbi:hypothetical protein BST61_g5490 [Cercospora zeina]